MIEFSLLKPLSIPISLKNRPWTPSGDLQRSQTPSCFWPPSQPLIFPLPGFWSKVAESPDRNLSSCSFIRQISLRKIEASVIWSWKKGGWKEDISFQENTELKDSRNTKIYIWTCSKTSGSICFTPKTPKISFFDLSKSFFKIAWWNFQ